MQAKRNGAVSKPFLYEAVVPMSRKSPSPRMLWCNENIGRAMSDWDLHFDPNTRTTTFYFDDEKIAFEFLLRFA